MSSWKNLLFVAAALFLTACGSTPQSNHYMLSTIGEGTAGNTGPAIGIGPITVPEYLNRNAMVLNEDSNRLKIAKYDRWAEPMGNGIQRVVAVNLAELLDTQQVDIFPWARSATVQYSVEINVVEFSAHGTSTRLIAKWVLQDVKAGKVLAQKISRLSSQAASAEPASIAAAYSDLLAQLSREIAGKFP
jgi:uncharacterized lipoprotein YmbA